MITTPEWPEHITATRDKAGNMIFNIKTTEETRMTIEEIKNLINGYGDAAFREGEVGFIDKACPKDSRMAFNALLEAIEQYAAQSYEQGMKDSIT